MSSAAPTKRDQAPNTLPHGKGLLNWLSPLVSSTVGMKIIVALTGIGLIGFVIGHMIGHLKMFAGQEAYNNYAKFLKDLGPLLWIARGGLLAIFVIHILLTLRLRARAKAARPVNYLYVQTVQASPASRFMMYAGLAILAFVIFHIAHFTLGYLVGAQALDRSTGKYVLANYLDLRDAAGRHDVYSAMISGLSNPILAIIYLAAMGMLFMHLTHGSFSLFQTLGLNTPRTDRFLKIAARLLAIVVTLGYSLVVIAVWSGWLKPAATFLAVSND
ncbi:succinate dehydrogenase cytochrome b subunit [Telmatocola sphagniphila]|uniref:Succinate dehydrogenase cytochrome b subunit n=1 Tax=Telmatocola sphagniphila TaxID=1123043 RepID=A0A8E6ETJ4_9BACT|nr:succinate dehydrogenase cytochrome b subunit [Telmatocola sphagniphila]QVL30022.1 succinate dehydrogenase cytochrome b subunit [Telmatocola sphagniphila]